MRGAGRFPPGLPGVLGAGKSSVASAQGLCGARWYLGHLCRAGGSSVGTARGGSGPLEPLLWCAVSAVPGCGCLPKYLQALSHHGEMCARSLGSGEERANAQATCLRPCFQISPSLNSLRCTALASSPSPEQTPKGPFGTKQSHPFGAAPSRRAAGGNKPVEMELCSRGGSATN